MMNSILENRRLSRWSTILPRAPNQRGAIHEADAELLPLGDGRLLALTVDQIVEEVTIGLYRLPETVGRMAATASLSDLAAVGADVLGLLMSVTLPHEDCDSVQDAVALGIRDVAERAGTHVIGGDTNEGAALSISCTAVGTVPEGQVLTRLGATPGDTVYATGPLGLGAAFAAVQLLGMPESLLPEQDFRPSLRLVEGRALRGMATSCMDSSDGLLATLDQLARLNDAAIVIDEDPSSLLHPGIDRIRAALRVGPIPLLAAIHGEFELIFSIAPTVHTRFRDLCSAHSLSPLRLGRFERGSGVHIGRRKLDTTSIRNLGQGASNDPHHYFQQLLELCAGSPS